MNGFKERFISSNLPAWCCFCCFLLKLKRTCCTADVLKCQSSIYADHSFIIASLHREKVLPIFMLIHCHNFWDTLRHWAVIIVYVYSCCQWLKRVQEDGFPVFCFAASIYLIPFFKKCSVLSTKASWNSWYVKNNLFHLRSLLSWVSPKI